VAVHRHARGEVAGRQAVGRLRHAAHRPRDRPAEVRGERQQQRDARHEHDGADRDRARRGGLGVGAAHVGQALLARVEAGELRAKFIDPALALGGRGRRVLAADGLDLRDRVLVDVSLHLGGDLLGECLLGRVACDERRQALGLPRQRRPCRPPRLQEPLLARQREPAGPGLQVQYELLGLVGGGQDLGGVPRRPRRGAHVDDGDQQCAERDPDYRRQRPAQDHHAHGQAVARPHKSASGPSTSRTFSSSWIGEKGLVM
jgi:hypothetical protein